jgi:hypothetical protein
LAEVFYFFIYGFYWFPVEAHTVLDLWSWLSMLSGAP